MYILVRLTTTTAPVLRSSAASRSLHTGTCEYALCTGEPNHSFGDSVGLMGDFAFGRMVARDGKTVVTEPNTFGQEWQVLETEPSLFQSLRLPQHPLECTLPPPVKASQLRRRLLKSPVDENAAEKACAHWGEGKDDCVFDVLTTGDLEMAMVGAY
jgi:hypothetical protein